MSVTANKLPQELYLEQDIREIYLEMLNKNFKITLAHKDDVDEIDKLLMTYTKEEIILARSQEQIYADLPFTYVVKTFAKVIAVMNFSFFQPNLAEIRGLVIDQCFQRMAVGKRLLQFALTSLASRKEDIKKLKIDANELRLFALTYKPNFFVSCDFTICEKSEFPQKIYEVCQFCVKKDDCKEIAVERRIKFDEK